MVTKKKKLTDSWEIPRVRIESRELLEIIKSLSSNSSVGVTAETNNHKFESLEDIERNIELFQGEIEIKIGPIGINLTDGFMRGVRILWRVPEADISGAEAYAERFIARISKYKVYFSYNLIRSGTALLLACIFTYYGIMPYTKSIFPSSSDILVFSISILTYWVGLFSLIGLIIKKRPSVYYLARDSFWSRNKDKIFLGTIMLILGIVATKITDFFI
jgi:hypothetical protein